MKVRRTEIPLPPAPPEEVADGLEAGWDDPSVEPTMRTTTLLTPPGGTTGTENTVEDEYEEWLSDWRVWANEVRDAYQVNLLFNQLFDTRTEMEREAERFELVVGDGILNWSRQSGGIEFPVLLQRLQLDYDPVIPEFSILEADRPPELNVTLLRHAGVDGAIISSLGSQAQSMVVSPLGGDRATSFLQILATSIAPDGKFLDARGPGELSFPRVWRDQVIFLRNRAQGFEAAIANILEDLEANDSFPDSLTSICGIQAEADSDDLPEETLGHADEVSDVLLSKEANSEQLEIARRLRRYGAVRVQGPPGTGKTHTIANLVGSLLAEGQSVLVTSHTTKALRVLREKIAPELQPLCVSVLEGDAASRAQLSDAVTRISARLSSGSPDQLLREADSLRRHREALLANIKAQRARLLAAVTGEYAEVVVSGRSLTTEQAGRLVADGIGQHDWVPRPVKGELPLSPVELDLLYRTNIQVTAEQEEWIDERLPKVDDLMRPETLEAILIRLSEIQASGEAGHMSEVWTEHSGSAEVLGNLAKDTEIAFSKILGQPDWYFAAAAAGAATDAEKAPWEEMVALLDDASRTAGELRRTRMSKDPRLPSELRAEEALRAVSEMKAHVEKGGSFGWLVSKRHGQWSKILNGSSCAGSPPWTVETLDALATIPMAEVAWTKVRSRWPLQMTDVGATLPGTDTSAEEAMCVSIAKSLTEALEFPRTVVAPLATRAHELGLNWAKVAPETELAVPNAAQWRRLVETIHSEMPRIIRAEALRAERDSLLDQLDHALVRLKSQPLATVAGSPIARLASALEARSPRDYAAVHAELTSLVERSKNLDARRSLLLRLEANAADWAMAVRRRVPPHDGEQVPGDVQAAWEWAVIRQTLEQRAQEDIETLIEGIELAKGELRKTTSELIDRLAWANQMRRTKPEARQALQVWLATIKKIGKGTGKNVPLLRRAAQQQMAVAQEAVPVWIAPLSRVAESFDARHTKFDVVIIDEASQSDVMGLIALYLGDRVVVVGDDQQVTPAAIGDQIATANQLIASFLQGIPGSHLYDGQYSIYEIAGTAFAGVTQLREHFRCVPDIIRFSNELSYDWRIVPLRDPSSAAVSPAVIVHRVEDGQSENRRNRQEAWHVASLILAACEQEEYSGLTFGMISLLGAEQSRDVEVLLRNNMSLGEYERRRVLCGTPPQFQGDERDVVFLSMVDGPAEDGGALPSRGDPGELWKKRYNVAASRARDQLWVVTSLDVGRDLKPGDLRWRLLEFARNPRGLQSRVAEAEARTESPLESDVMRRLVAAGYRVVPQVEVGAYRIDLVVEDAQRKLAVECDGDRYHTQENLQNDLERQAQLERLGWRFVRIRGSAFFRDPELAMKPVFKRLSDLGIEKDGSGAPNSAEEEVSVELVERVRRRADEIRASWDTRQNSSFATSSHRGRAARFVKKTVVGEGPSTEQPVAPAAPHAQPALSTGPQQGQALHAQTNQAELLNEVSSVLESQGFRIDDKRAKGGAFWVYDPERQLQGFMKTLTGRGMRFRYSPGRNGWFWK